MKNIFVAAVFLFSQLGLTAEKMDQINAKGYHLENEKFSSLILTKEELSHLSNKDKAEYLFSIIALTHILEIAQSEKMGYEEEGIQKKTTVNDSKILQLLEVSVPKSNAFWLAAGGIILEGIGGLVVWEAVKGTFKYVTSKAAARVAAGMVEKKAGTELALVGATSGAAKGSKAAIQEGEEFLKRFAKKATSADTALKANTDPKKKMILLKEAMEAEKALNFAKDSFVKDFGGDPKKVSKLVDGSLFSRYVTIENTAKIALAGLAITGAATLAKTAVGGDPTDIAIGSSDTAARTVAADLKAGDSKQEKGKSCIFGGHPSRWKEFPEVGIKCTRPDSSRSESCKGDNQFLCADYGITLAEGSIQAELCIDKAPLDNLTVRCTEKLHAVLEKKKALLNPDKLVAHQKEIKEIIAKIEDSPSMKDEEGKTKSIFQYCDAKPDAQKTECAAIQGVLAALKQTGVPNVIAARATTPVTAPPAATLDPATAAGTTH